jgi:hypothetical protein
LKIIEPIMVLHVFIVRLGANGLPSAATGCQKLQLTNIHTYHSGFIPKGVAKASQSLL